MNNNFKENLAVLSRNASRLIKRYTPEILLGMSILAYGESLYLTAKAAPKAKEALDDLHVRLGESDEKLSKYEIILEEVKTAGPYYIRPIVAFALATGCALSSYKVQSGRTAAWAAAYEIAHKDLIDIREATKEAIGEKKAAEIEHIIDQKAVEEDPPKHENREEVVSDGTSLYKIKYGGRYVRATRDEVWQAVKTISDRLNVEMWIPLNDFYWELGLSNTGEGDQVGFSVEDGIDIIFGSALTPSGEPCGLIKFVNDPRPDKYGGN